MTKFDCTKATTYYFASIEQFSILISSRIIHIGNNEKVIINNSKIFIFNKASVWQNIVYRTHTIKKKNNITARVSK